MKFRVNNMPYTPDECPFHEYYWKAGVYYDVCKIDGRDCEYFKHRNPVDCNWLIDEEWENELKNPRH